MQRVLTSAVMAGALLTGGFAAGAEAAPAGAARTASVQHVTSAFTHTTTGATSVAGAHQRVAKESSVDRSRPRPRPRARTHRRGFFSRIFGTLMFLFIGLPLLIVLAIVVMVMMRRGRKQQEAQMRQDRAYQDRAYGQPDDQQRYGSGPNDRY